MAVSSTNNLLRVIRVVIASPADVRSERDVAERVVREVSESVGLKHGLALQPWRWETDAHPGFHPRGPQGLIDELMRVQDAELIVGIFWSRFGTPADANGDSGTAHELRLAVESWRARSRPQIMVYFNGRRPVLKSAADTAQYQSLQHFKECFPPLGLWYDYQRKKDFESILRHHLISWVYNIASGATLPGSPAAVGFEAPRSSQLVQRSTELSRLASLHASHGVVAVEGISGVGKSSLVSMFAAAYQRGVVYWHEPQAGETLDALLLKFGVSAELSGSSTSARTRSLLTHLQHSDGLLVVDNYHRVDSESYGALLAMAARSGEPARVILTHRMVLDPVHSETGIGHLSLSGFSCDETMAALERRGVKQGLPVVRELVEKTEGLPFAVEQFATLLGPPYRRSPRELLEGSMLRSERLKSWFSEVVSALSEDAVRMLQFLSLVDETFDIALVRVAAEQARLMNEDAAFDQLQRASLTISYDGAEGGLWHIHHLVAMLSTSGLTDAERHQTHSALARHYLSQARLQRDTTGARLLSTIRACRQLKLARDFADLVRVLNGVISQIKSRGYHRSFVQLVSSEVRAQVHDDDWFLYHYAHCCFVTGRWVDALEVIEPLVHKTSVALDLRVASARLYAELLDVMRQTSLALSTISEALAVGEAGGAKPVVLSHARSVKAALHLRLMQFGEARKDIDVLLRDASKRQDKLAAAVGLTLEAALAIRLSDPGRARERAQAAVALFRARRDARGTCWAKSVLAAALFELGDVLSAEGALAESMKLAADIDDCSPDYLKVLRDYKGRCVTPDLVRVIEDELRRVELAIDIRHRG